MESMKMPYREIEEKFTRSELAVMAWRSQEIAFQMRPKDDTGKASKKPAANTKQEWAESSQMSEDDAVKMMAKLGIPLMTLK